MIMNADSNSPLRRPKDKAPVVQPDDDSGFQVNRELVLQLAKKAFPSGRFPDFDRIGPVRVMHRGAKTYILWGNLKLESFEETDASKTAERIINRVKSILEEDFDEIEFYQGFCNAYWRTLDWQPLVRAKSRDYSVRIDHLYNEFLWERIRNAMAQETGRKPTAIAPYSLAEFLVDFARYLRDPDPPGYLDDYLSLPTLTVGQKAQAYLVPNLQDISADETPILKVQLLPDGEI